MLATTICGAHFRNPILVAAGPPVKDADACIACGVGGAGGIIAKTVSAKPAEVPRTCMARPSSTLRDSMLNVELWSDISVEKWVAEEYPKINKDMAAGVGRWASVGYSAEDMAKIVPLIDPLVEGFEFSCHYTDTAAIQGVARAIRGATKKPVFAKLSPHGHDLLALAKTLKDCGVDGFVLMNSLGPCLSLDVNTEMPLLGGEGGKGWLSGPAIHPVAVYWVSHLHQAMPEMPIIAVGGVSTWKDAAEFILVGAVAVEVCTAAIYQGPKVLGEIAAGLEAWCVSKGVKNISELRGRALKNLPKESNLIPPVSSADAKCIHCSSCVKVCSYDAITVDKANKKWSVVADKCYGCGLCSTVCPKDAITMVKRA